MNFDQLQEQWQNEEVSLPEISLEAQKKFTHPLEKIRKNMRMEFWLNLISIIVLIPLSSVFSENPFLRWTLFTVLMFITGYFTYRFYTYYRKFSVLSLDTYHRLLELKYEMKIIKELYASYYVSSIPFLMGLFFLFLKKHDFFKYNDLIMHYAPVIIFFSFSAIVLGIGVWWFKAYYGKYITQIENLIKELK